MNWDGKQKKNLPGGLGFTWPGLTTHGMGYSVMVYQNPRYWTGRGPATVFVHEWCHQLEFFYPKLGVKLPRQGLHGTHLYPGQGENWYARFLNGRWKSGTVPCGGWGRRRGASAPCGSGTPPSTSPRAQEPPGTPVD